MNKAKIADKIEKQLKHYQQAVLSAGEWEAVIEALRTQKSDAMSREYVLPASASHGSR